LHNPPLNKILKILVGYVKPVARMAALFWLKRNLPNLLTAWLESKVSFDSVPVNDNQTSTGDLEAVLASEVQVPDELVNANTLPNIDSPQSP
jgi:hypothetical protein